MGPAPARRSATGCGPRPRRSRPSTHRRHGGCASATRPSRWGHGRAGANAVSERPPAIDPAPPDGRDRRPAGPPVSEVARRHGLLTEQPHAYARGSRARSTWAAYDRQWRRFETWFAEIGGDPAAGRGADRGPVPGRPGPGLAPGHSGQPAPRGGRRAGPRPRRPSARLDRGLPDRDLGGPPERRDTQRCRERCSSTHHGRHPPPRRRGRPRAAAPPPAATTSPPSWPPSPPTSTLADVRDAALLLIGWKAALRSDDLARLQMDDLRVTDEGLALHLRRSKTDQASDGSPSASPEAPPRPRRRRPPTPASSRTPRSWQRCRWMRLPRGRAGATCSAATASPPARCGGASTATGVVPAPAGGPATPIG